MENFEEMVERATSNLSEDAVEKVREKVESLKDSTINEYAKLQMIAWDQQ